MDKNKNISENARRAYEDFKEEIGQEINFDEKKISKAAGNIKEKIKDIYTNIKKS